MSIQPTQPLVSFCLTTYKRADHLFNTLQSISKQSFTDYEVIVSDNDPGRSGEIVTNRVDDDKFKYYSNEQNLGMKKSFNKSLERSSGQYIVMIADDDPVYPGKGSAIFLHYARADFSPTAGCVALRREDLVEALEQFQPTDRIVIR